MSLLELVNPMRRALASQTWPPRSQEAVWDEIELLSALRSSNDATLRMREGVAWNYPYLITPVPRMLSRTSANLLFGQEVELGDDADADAVGVETIYEENDLSSELIRAGLVSSSEGEVWGRVLVRPDLLDYPIIDFCSRDRVIPEFSGRFLVAATFVTEWYEGSQTVFRLLERHSAGRVEHTLYRGTSISIGTTQLLDSYGPTTGMQDVVETGIPYPLVEFIPNTIDSDPTRGFSDYRGLEARFLALNRETTVGHSNVMLTGKKRALIEGRFAGRLSQDDTMLIRSADDAMAGTPGNRPLEVLEFGFEATQLVTWIDHMIDTSIVMAGLAPQLVGRSVDGGAISGTALRLKVAHALIEASGKGRHFDGAMRSLLRMAKMLDKSAFGRRYRDVTSLPQFERGDMLPHDDMEAAQRLVLLTNANAISLVEKVRAANPDWDQAQIDAEVALIGATSVGLSGPVPPMSTVQTFPGGDAVPAATLQMPPGGPTPGQPAA